jgi:hypothetical protein
LKKIYFSSHKLPKQQSTSFWSQGILGVKEKHVELIKKSSKMDKVGKVVKAKIESKKVESKEVGLAARRPFKSPLID